MASEKQKEVQGARSARTTQVQEAASRIAELKKLPVDACLAALRREGRQFFRSNARGVCDACGRRGAALLCDHGEQECVRCYCKRYAATVFCSLAGVRP